MHRYRVLGMDCAHDAAAVEAAVRRVLGIDAVRVSAASHVLSFEGDADAAQLPAVSAAVAGLGYRLEPLPDIDGARPATHTTPAYRRALGMVAALNVGYGAVEMAAGFLADSQALKADALDFVGDGLITALALLAIAWSARWRARMALLQGAFLALLGSGVLVHTGYRVLVQQQPEAATMGLFGLIALFVNLAAAAMLIPHRDGDANVRAIWLFSRNDAIGNAAVVLAAGLVAWTRTPWPDLVVAVVIAALFLHSAAVIVRDARRDLREAPVSG